MVLVVGNCSNLGTCIYSTGLISDCNTMDTIRRKKMIINDEDNFNSEDKEWDDTDLLESDDGDLDDEL